MLPMVIWVKGLLRWLERHEVQISSSELLQSLLGLPVLSDCRMSLDALVVFLNQSKVVPFVLINNELVEKGKIFDK